MKGTTAIALGEAAGAGVWAHALGPGVVVGFGVGLALGLTLAGVALGDAGTGEGVALPVGVALGAALVEGDTVAIGAGDEPDPPPPHAAIETMRKNETNARLSKDVHLPMRLDSWRTLGSGDWLAEPERRGVRA